MEKNLNEFSRVDDAIAVDMRQQELYRIFVQAQMGQMRSASGQDVILLSLPEGYDLEQVVF